MNYLKNNLQNQRVLLWSRNFASPMIGVLEVIEETVKLSPCQLSAEEMDRFGATVERITYFNLADLTLVQEL